jgi:hypothetical protein
MTRAVRVAVATAAALVAILTIVGCGNGAEYLIVQRFFAASQLRDRTALARFATTIFEPRIDGSVDRFKILHVSADTPYQPEGGSTGSIATADRVAQLSLDDPVNMVDIGSAEPTLVQRTVTIEAEVRRPDGGRATLRMGLVLVKATVSQPRRRDGRWIVTAFR